MLSSTLVLGLVAYWGRAVIITNHRHTLTWAKICPWLQRKQTCPSIVASYGCVPTSHSRVEVIVENRKCQRVPSNLHTDSTDGIVAHTGPLPCTGKGTRHVSRQNTQRNTLLMERTGHPRAWNPSLWITMTGGKWTEQLRSSNCLGATPFSKAPLSCERTSWRDCQQQYYMIYILDTFNVNCIFSAHTDRKSVV